MVPLLTYTLAGLLTNFAIMWWLGLYRRYWRYASVEELALIVIAMVVGGIVALAIQGLVIGPAFLGAYPSLPRSLPILVAMLTVGFVGASRFSIRLAEHLRRKWQGQGGSTGEYVLIIGAGAAGSTMVRELRANPQLGLEPLGFVDDDVTKRGHMIHGVPVLGNRDDIPALAREYGISKVIIAMPTAPGKVIREVRDVCESAKLNTKIMPGFFDIISGRVSVSQLRDVQIEDLLRRKPVQTDQKAVRELVQGSTVLVTGAGGSIGSEICRQVSLLGARELVLVGHGENSIFDATNELRTLDPELTIVPVIADIRDGARMERILRTYRPQAVFHAAAHKHVPLMELNPEEAVTNNVIGTANVVAAAMAANVPRFVLISTDKAVNPSSVMGATKLMAEAIVHAAAASTGAAYVSVRFGNVLGSRGSVVPLFQQQIRAGGPITITHPEMTRYFMTIPEAVQLVLQAAALGQGGETFLLDMGEPVKIVQLARDMVQLSGLELDRDIKIIFSGLRPGEKLFEELYGNTENLDRTAHEKIFVLRNGKKPSTQITRIEELREAATVGDGIRLRHLLADIVPDFAPAVGGRPPKLEPRVEGRTSGKIAKPAVPGLEAGRPSGKTALPSGA
ncbi:MAG TPA: nucleoside-diphosphate sugar epimerase/dehydratase [Gemmatimonadales bacterium]